jgi:regulator of replication initiation timing
VTVDVYRWIDPDDAIFVSSCRDSLKMERAAWAACHARCTALVAENAALRIEISNLREESDGPR